MPLEATVTTIADLVATDPLDTDVAQQGAGHIRNIKAALKGTFPNVTGEVTASDTELNNITKTLSSDGTTLTIPTLSVTKSVTVPALTDWSGYTAVGAKDADARYVQLGAANTITGNNTFSGKINVTGTLSYNGTVVATTTDLNTAITGVKTWANSEFVAALSGADGGVNGATMDASGNPSFRDTAGKWHVCQPYGKYQAAGDYVNRDGDTMTGPLTSSGWIFGGVNGGMTGTATQGNYMWSEGIGFGNPYNSGNFRGTWCVSDVFGEGGANTAGVNLTGYDAASKVYQWYFAWNGNITTPKGLVAFTSDLPTSGIIAANGNYGTCYWTQIGSVLTQTFKYTMDSGGDQITWPKAFSSNDVVPVCKGFTNGGYQEGGFEPATVNSTGGKLDRFNYDQGDSVVYITVTGPA